jgi:hypothetical protein
MPLLEELATKLPIESFKLIEQMMNTELLPHFTKKILIIRLNRTSDEPIHERVIEWHL